MKKLLFITSLMVSSFMGFASSDRNELDFPSKYPIEKLLVHFCQNDCEILSAKDCTVRLNFELEDGTTIKGELTFVDVSWWNCTKMQVAAWWKRTF